MLKEIIEVYKYFAISSILVGVLLLISGFGLDWVFVESLVDTFIIVNIVVFFYIITTKEWKYVAYA